MIWPPQNTGLFEFKIPCCVCPGNLYAWGSNAFGQLGLGDYLDRTDPTLIAANGLYAAAALNTSAIIKADNSLWACGALYSDVNVFTQIGTDVDWVFVTGGEASFLAIKTDGTLWAWGFNGTGQLGLGDTAFRSAPVQIGADTDWLTVYLVSDNPGADQCHSMAIKTDGTLWAWGFNAVGQLGLGDTTERDSPVQVGSATDWVKIYGGGSSGGGWSAAIKFDGTLWATGLNDAGQLGVGDFVNRNIFTQEANADLNWAETGSFSAATFAIKTDGTLWETDDITGKFLQHGSDSDWTVFSTCVAKFTLKVGGSLWSTAGLVQVGTDTGWTFASASNEHQLAIR